MEKWKKNVCLSPSLLVLEFKIVLLLILKNLTFFSVCSYEDIGDRLYLRIEYKK